jgi:hypothetical protein
MDKNNIINNVYHDQSGYSSIQKTYEEAREKITVSPLKMLGIGLLKMLKERSN